MAESISGIRLMVPLLSECVTPCYQEYFKRRLFPINRFYLKCQVRRSTEYANFTRYRMCKVFNSLSSCAGD